jgi:hypothetical protein
VQPKREYVGIDLHRRRSVIVRMDGDGEVLACEQVVNDPVAFALAVGAGPDTEVALEATYGWYWAADLPRGTSRDRRGEPQEGLHLRHDLLGP